MTKHVDETLRQAVAVVCDQVGLRHGEDDRDLLDVLEKALADYADPDDAREFMILCVAKTVLALVGTALPVAIKNETTVVDVLHGWSDAEPVGGDPRTDP